MQKRISGTYIQEIYPLGEFGMRLVSQTQRELDTYDYGEEKSHVAGQRKIVQFT